VIPGLPYPEPVLAEEFDANTEYVLALPDTTERELYLAAELEHLRDAWRLHHPDPV